MVDASQRRGVQVSELLAQLKELHAPDRCEGPLNYMWRGVQSVTGSETSQQKIEKYWNENSSNHAGLLKKLTSDSLARQDLWEICKEVDPSRKPTSTKAQLDPFIDACQPKQLQQMFSLLIVSWVWRDRLLKAWPDIK